MFLTEEGRCHQQIFFTENRVVCIFLQKIRLKSGKVAKLTRQTQFLIESTATDVQLYLQFLFNNLNAIPGN